MHIPAAAREELKLPPYTAISTLQEALFQSFPHNPVFATTLLEELNGVFYAATKWWTDREKLMRKKSWTAAYGTLITGLWSPGVGKTPLSIAVTEVMGQPMKDMSALIRQLFTTLSPGIVQELKQHMANGIVLPAFVVVCSLVLEAQANEDTRGMSINGAPRDIQQISPIVDLFTKVDVVVRFAHLQTIMDRLQERAKNSIRKDDSVSVQQKRIMDYMREGVLVDLIMLELADSRWMAILDNPGSAFRHFGGKSREHIIQRATTIIEQTEELSFEEAIIFFVEIFFQSQSLQKRVQVQVSGVYCGENKQ